MGALQRLIGQVLSRLRDTSVSQRLALLLGGLLVAVSLVWLVQWAASPEQVALLEQDLGPEELARVRSGLEALGESYRVRGSRVYVPATANRGALLARLQEADKLPASTSSAFAALVQKSDPWISLEENDRRWTVALQTEIEKVLRQFQGVQNASVFLNLHTGRKGFSRQAPANSASVTLVMKNGDEVPRSLALAAARLVSGAVAGLPVRNVQVVDARGVSALDWDSEQDEANTLHRQRIRLEQHYTETIRRLIPDPKALVSVVVELVSTSSSTKTETPIRGVPRTEETTADETTRTHRSEPPGVQPNVGLTAVAGGADESQKKDMTRTEYQTGVALKTEATPAGDVKLVTAAIRLSSSYLEGIWRHTHPEAGPPTDEQLEEVFQAERKRLLGQVVRLVKPQVEENVDIQRYWDTALPGPAVAGAAPTLDQAVRLVRRYGAQSGLGLLALLSLGLMLRMARKSDTSEVFGLELGLPQDAIEAAKRAAEDVAEQTARRARAARTGAQPAGAAGAGVTGEGAPSPDGSPGVEPVLEAAVLPVGQAAPTEGVLVAQEVDPGAIQTRKMIDQITQMVDSDAAVVSSLLEHWVQRCEAYRESG
jgi:flagellar biosynthesis/type III secretory pathway M-ring protein FliF/YscJ